MSMSARVTRKRAKEQQEAHMAAAAVAAAASSSSSAPPSFARPIPVPASSSSHKRKGQQPAKKKPKRDHNEAAAEGEETEDHDVTMAAASSSSSPAPFDPYLPRDLLRIVFQYAPPSQLSRYVPVCPWITSDGALCRSVMRYYAAQAPIKITEHTPSYHEQTLAGSFINNYPFHLSQTQRKSKQFAEESWELSATHFLCNPEDPEWDNTMDVSMDFLQILRDAGMWDDEVNAIHSPESAAALAVFKDTPEYQTYARLAPYNSMFQRVNLPLVNIYHDFPLTSADEGEPQVYERPLHQMEKELWRKWEGPMEKLDVATVGGGTTGAGAAAALSSSSSAPASSSPVSSSTSPLTSTPLFRSQSSFLSTFHALFLHRLWHASIDWTRFLCVGGSVLRSVLNSEFHDFDAFQEDPAAGLEKQDVDFFWTSSDDFYAFTKCYTAWKKTVRRWMGEENVRVVSETDYVQVVEVRFDEAETKEFVSAPQKPKGAKKKQTGRKGKKTAEVSEEDDDEEEQEDEDDGSEDAKNDASRRLPPGGRIVTFNFIWYDSSLSASSILNIFDLDVCQVAFDGEDCVITPAGLEALRTRTMLNYKLVNSPKDVRYIAPRSRKYVARGFHLYVPLSFQDDVLTSAWEQAVQMTERMKKKMVRVEVHRRQRQKADEKRRKEWQAKQAAGGVSKSKGKRGKAAAAAKKAEDDDEADDDPIDISSIPTPSLTPCDMNTLKLDRSEGRRGHFFEAGRRVLPEIGAYEVGRAEPSDDDEAGDGDDDDDEAGLGEDGQASGGWDGETHYSGFLLNNDSMRVRQAFLEKIVRAENHAGDW